MRRSNANDAPGGRVDVNVQHISSPVRLIDKGSPLTIQRTDLSKTPVADNSPAAAAADAAGNPRRFRVGILSEFKLKKNVIAAPMPMSTGREQHGRKDGS